MENTYSKVEGGGVGGRTSYDVHRVHICALCTAATSEYLVLLYCFILLLQFEYIICCLYDTYNTE